MDNHEIATWKLILNSVWYGNRLLLELVHSYKLAGFIYNVKVVKIKFFKNKVIEAFVSYKKLLDLSVPRNLYSSRREWWV